MRQWLYLIALLAPLGCQRGRGQYDGDRSWRVMGTELHARVWATDSAAANRALAAAHDEVLLVDNLTSTDQDNSEVSVANRRAGKDSITYISPSLTSLIATVIKYSQATDGALDVTLGPLVNVWGFRDNKPRLPTAAQQDSARRLVGLKRIVFNESERTIKLTKRGMQLDPGPLAGGLALDRAARAMRAAGAQAGILELSGNTLHFGALPEGHRSVSIHDPRDHQKELASLQVDSGVVATAASAVSHIFDARTGQPVQGRASATVVARSGLDAAALSTALFVLGPEKGCAVAEREHVEAIWIMPESGGSTVLRLTATPGIDAQLHLTNAIPRARCPV